MNSQTYSKLGEISDRAVRLCRAGVIKKCTENFFLESCKVVNEEIELYRAWGEISEQNLKRTLNQMLLLEEILTRSELGQSVDRSYDDYFIEIFNRLGDFNVIDLWVIKFGRGHSPLCMPPYILQDALSFILIIPESPNYLTPELIGLLAHEASHLEGTIAKFLYSIKSDRMKVGESLADLLAYILTDSLFLHSANHLIKKIGIDNAVKTRPRHLSWASRLFVLYYLTDLIWQNREVADKNKGYLQWIMNESPVINPFEEHLITVCTREGKDKIAEFTKFKIDENILSNIKNLSSTDLNMLGVIIRIIHDIEVSD